MNSTGPLWARPPDGPAPGLAYANAVQRAAATIIDYVIVVVVGGIPYTAMGAGSPTASPTVAALGSWIVAIACFVVFGATLAIWNGQTIGGRLIGLRVVRRSDGSRIGWGRALLRPIGVLLTVTFWFISVLAVSLGKEKRTPADALTGTVVIRAVRTNGADPMQPPEQTVVVEA